MYRKYWLIIIIISVYHYTACVIITVAKAIFENIEILSSVMEPITLGTVGTQKPYRFTFEQYVQEARTKMPSRKAAGKFGIVHIL